MRSPIVGMLALAVACGTPPAPCDPSVCPEDARTGESPDAAAGTDAGGNSGSDGGTVDAGPVDGGGVNDGRSDAGRRDGGNVSGSCVGTVPLVYNAATDRMPHPATPPALGDAGTIVLDPIYGTKMLRLTDANTLGPTVSFRVANEFWGNDWNTDATRFYIQTSKSGLVAFKFDPATMTATKEPFALPFGASGGFSRVNPDLLYGIKGLSFAQFDLATQQTTILFDLHTLVPDAGGYALGVEQGANGLFATAFGGPQQDEMPYVATWDPATGAHHLIDTYASTLDGAPIGMVLDAGVHTIRIDSSGRYIDFSIAGGSDPNFIWDTTTNTVRNGGTGTPGWGAGIVHARGDSYEWAVYDVATQMTSAPLITPLLTPTDNLVSTHVDWQNAVQGALVPFIVETMRQPTDTGPTRAWDQELIAVQSDVPDGGASVWRFAHNFNTYTGTIYSDNFYYLFIPRVSQNGWFAIIDSNWNQSLGTDSSGQPRTDVFVVALPNPCGP